MCLIHCDVRIWTAWLSRSDVRRGPRHRRRNCPQPPAGDRLWRETDSAGRCTGGAEESSEVHQTRGHGTQGVRSPGTDNSITKADYGPAVTTVPPSAVRPLDVRSTVRDIETGARTSQENSESGRNRQRATTGVGRDETAHMTIRSRSPSFENAVSECAVLSSWGSPNSPPAFRGPRTEVDRLPGLFGSDRTQFRGWIA